MLKIGEITLGEKPQIVVSFGADTTPTNISHAKKQGMNIAELRVDLLDTQEAEQIIQVIKQFKNIPVLLTIRSKAESGQWQKTEAARLALFQKLIPFVDAVDIELSSNIKQDVITFAQQAGKIVQVSQHNFKKTPCLEELNQLFMQAHQLTQCDIFKFAGQIHTQADLHTLTAFLHQHQTDNIVLIGMGDLGKSSRIFFPSLGSLYTFSYIGESTAPGQFNLKETRSLFNQFY